MTQEQPEPTVGALVHDLSTQIPELVRSELRLAQAEMAEKGKRAGLGLGAFSAAGLLILFALATFIACAVLGLAHAVDAWLAALIVGVALVLAAGVAAIVGRREIAEATPPAPERAVEGLKEDLATVKGESR